MLSETILPIDDFSNGVFVSQTLFFLSTNSLTFSLSMHHGTYRQPSLYKLLYNVDCCEDIFMRLKFPTILSISRTSSVLKTMSEDHGRLRLNYYLSSFAEPQHFRQVMRNTTSTVFDISTVEFISSSSAMYGVFRELFLCVGAPKYEELLAQIIGIGYTICRSTGTVMDDFRRLDVNPFLQSWTCVKNEKRKRTIIIGKSSDDSSRLPCVGTNNTALMNGIGPDSMWMAYPRWTLASFALNNGMLFLKGPGYEHEVYKRVTDRLVRFLGLSIYEGTSKRKSSRRPHPRFELGDCPQARRNDQDSFCLTFKFIRASEGDIQQDEGETERTEGDCEVWWRLGETAGCAEGGEFNPFANAVRKSRSQSSFSNANEGGRQ